MMNAEERQRLQRKLFLLTGAELAEVDSRLEEIIARRRRFAENVCERKENV